MTDVSRNEDRDLNRDPITGEPGAHPIGTGMGAASGAVAGAAAAAATGPLGATIGSLIGAIMGGLAGKGLGEAINPTTENRYWENYWREAYRNEPYFVPGQTFEDYSAAYRLGFEFCVSRGGRNWEASQEQLRMEWNRKQGCFAAAMGRGEACDACRLVPCQVLREHAASAGSRGALLPGRIFGVIF